MTRNEDDKLLRTFIDEGSEDAFCRLVERHADLVSRIVHKRIPDHESAKDAVQSVFCLMARKASTLANHSSIAGWLVQTAIFESRKYHRKEANRMKRETVHVEHREMSHEDQSFSEEDFALVEDALSDLPMKYRNAIMMRYYQGDSFKKIGARLGKSDGAAQKLVTRGVERLRHLVNRRHPDGGFDSATTLVLLTGTLAVKPMTTALGANSIGIAALHSSAEFSKPFLLTNALLPSMTATQIKLTIGLVLVAAVPVIHQLRKHDIDPDKVSSINPSQEHGQAATLLSGIKPLTSSQSNDSGVRIRDSSERAEASSLTAEEWRDRRAYNLIKDLTDKEWKIRRGAAAMLRDSDLPADIVVPALIHALGDEEWQVRQVVATALASYGSESAAAVPHLISALNDEEWHVRAVAADALGAIGAEAKGAVPKLIDVLGDEEWQVRNPAAMALARIGPEAAPAVAVLTRSLADEEWHVATNAGAALAAIGPQAAPAVSALIEALDHDEWQVRSSAAFALGSIGADAHEAIDHLSIHLNDEEPKVRQIVLGAIREIQGDE